MSSIKRQFINNLNTIPLKYEVIALDLTYKSIVEAVTLIENGYVEKAERLIVNYMEELLEESFSQKNIPFIIDHMLAISEIPQINCEIGDLALDMMIACEWYPQLSIDKKGGFIESMKKIKTKCPSS